MKVLLAGDDSVTLRLAGTILGMVLIRVLLSVERK